MPDGKSKFLIKKYLELKVLPAPTGTIGGEMGVVKGAKSNLEVSTDYCKNGRF